MILNVDGTEASSRTTKSDCAIKARQEVRRAEFVDEVRFGAGVSFGGEHAHAERFGFARQFQADGAEADDAEGLAFDFDRLKLLPFLLRLRRDASGSFFARVKMQANANSENTVP